jgi:hypothetical protein
VVYGTSATRRGWWDPGPVEQLGYRPMEDAEAWAAEVDNAERIPPSPVRVLREAPTPAERAHSAVHASYSNRRSCGGGGQRSVHRTGGGAGARVPAGPPGDHERGRHGHRSGAAAGRVDDGWRAACPPAAGGDLGGRRLPGRGRLGGGVRAVPGGPSLLGAPGAAYGFVRIPFATVLLSAWLDNEPLGIGLLLGRLLVLSGVYVRALRPMGPGSTPGGISPRR